MKRQHLHIDVNKKLNNHQRFFKALTADINWVNSLLTILFIGTLYLTVFEIDIYRKTIIHWAIPVGIWFGTGLVLTPLTSDFLAKNYSTVGFFMKLVFNVVTWGGLLTYGLLATNYYFVSGKSETVKAKIIYRSNYPEGPELSSCAQPFCVVLIRDINKEIVFYCGTDIENYNYIDLTIKKGSLGFDIIVNQVLTNEDKNAL